VLAGALCMLAFTVPPEGYVGISDPPLRAGSTVWCLYAAALAGLFWLYTGKRRARLSAGMMLTGLLFGAVNFLATTLFAYDTWDTLASAPALIRAALCVLGQAAVMAAGLALVCEWLEGVWDSRDKRPSVAFAHARPDAPAGHAQSSADCLPADASDDWNAEPDAAHMATPAMDLPLPVMEPTGDSSPAGRVADCLPADASDALNAEPDAARAVTPDRFGLRRRYRRLADRFPRLDAWRRRHPVASVALLLLVCWSPYLIVFYPGTIIWDMGEMLGMLYGLRPMTTWHPVFATWLFGGAVALGRLFGSDNLGAFLFTALQSVAMAYALARVIRLLRKFGLGPGWRLAALALFGLTPIFGSFAQAVGKDTLYTAAILMVTVYTVETLRFGAPRGRALMGYAAWTLLACLVRNNGLYVAAGAAALVVAFGLRGRARLRVGGALAAALGLAIGFSGVLVPALGIRDATASGLYSVCFQQSARVLRDHADTVTPEEYAEIDLVLDAKNLPTLYEPVISDPVKYTFRQYGEGREAETAALTRYRQTWLSMLRKYPLTYLEAFVAGNSGYYAFTPKIDAARTYNQQGGIRFVFETYELGADARYLHTTQIEALKTARTLLAAYSRGWRRVPALELFLFCPVYTWLLVAAGLSLARRGYWRALIAFAPALLSLGVCLLSPVDDYFRYFLPIVAMTPLLLGLARTEKNTAA